MLIRVRSGLLFVVALLLTSVTLACGGSTPRQLQSITVSPAIRPMRKAQQAVRYNLRLLGTSTSHRSLRLL